MQPSISSGQTLGDASRYTLSQKRDKVIYAEDAEVAYVVGYYLLPLLKSSLAIATAPVVKSKGINHQF